MKDGNIQKICWVWDRWGDSSLQKSSGLSDCLGQMLGFRRNSWMLEETAGMSSKHSFTLIPLIFPSVTSLVRGEFQPFAYDPNAWLTCLPPTPTKRKPAPELVRLHSPQSFLCNTALVIVHYTWITNQPNTNPLMKKKKTCLGSRMWAG